MTHLAIGQTRITPAEYEWIQAFLFQSSGIELRKGKETLVVGRLDRRLRHHGLTSFSAYFALLSGAQTTGEAQVAVDLLTTNETSFFREPDHFRLLPGLLPDPGSLAGRPVRIWSAASSTGEEAYSIALTLADSLGGRPWEVVGTDISTRVLETARRGLYPLEASARIPAELLRAYCLKGRQEQEGLFTLASRLRSRVHFQQANLSQDLPALGQFDVVFLRNVLIYFGTDTKRQLLKRILSTLRPGGHLLIGHAESITGLGLGLTMTSPSVYQVAGG